MRLRFAAFVLLPLLLAPAGARGAPPAACGGNDGAPTHVLTGSLGQAQVGSYVLVPFEVADESTRLRVKLCYAQSDSPLSSQLRNTLDLGLYEPSVDGFYDEEEFRGWGGSSRLNVVITPEQATLGFTPGPIPAGGWAAEIGVAAIVPTEHGDSDGLVEWRLEVFSGSDPGDLDSPWQPAPYDTTPAASGPGWYKGDLHVHAEHSNPSGATMRETFDYAFGAGGLDFITLSDYVGSRHSDEIGRFQKDYPGKLVIRSAEIITYRGHVNNHFSHSFVDYRTGPIYEWRGGTLVPIRPAEPASRIFDDVHAAGGLTQINHPTTFDSTVPGFGNLCRGCSWEYSDPETQWSKVDAMEVQTGPAGTYDPDGHELGPNPFTPLAIEWWDRLRNEGYEITAVGSSDSHDAGHEELTQSPIGEATTVVYARELSEPGIQAGLDAGHAYVKFFGASGPDLRFSARPSGGSEPVVIMGDRLTAASAVFTARVMGAAPSPEVRTLVIFKDGKPILHLPVPTADFSIDLEMSLPGIYRLQLQRGSAIEALTNPITLVAP